MPDDTPSLDPPARRSVSFYDPFFAAMHEEGVLGPLHALRLPQHAGKDWLAALAAHAPAAVDYLLPNVVCDNACDDAWRSFCNFEDRHPLAHALDLTAAELADPTRADKISTVGAMAYLPHLAVHALLEQIAWDQRYGVEPGDSDAAEALLWRLGPAALAELMRSTCHTVSPIHTPVGEGQDHTAEDGMTAAQVRYFWIRLPPSELEHLLDWLDDVGDAAAARSDPTTRKRRVMQLYLLHHTPERDGC